jgi:hypothetical protein
MILPVSAKIRGLTGSGVSQAVKDGAGSLETDLRDMNGSPLIAGTKWRSKGDGERRAFGYTYDQANRILGADFSQYSVSNYTDNPNMIIPMIMLAG